jgi:predicted phosphohydrolase
VENEFQSILEKLQRYFKVKLVIISDTHNRHNEITVPDGDVLIHAGDSTMMGYRKESTNFHNWFCSQPHKNKILIAGNHDFNWERAYYEGQKAGYFPPQNLSEIGYNYLLDSGIEIQGVKFWGSPFVPEIGQWAFMYKRPTGRWNQIPNGTDVLITHGPPQGILDRPYGDYEHVGCKDLADKVLQLKPKIHIFGHIHGDAGIKEFNGTTFINASIVGEDYKVRNQPIEMEI